MMPGFLLDMTMIKFKDVLPRAIAALRESKGVAVAPYPARLIEDGSIHPSLDYLEFVLREYYDTTLVEFILGMDVDNIREV